MPPFNQQPPFDPKDHLLPPPSPPSPGSAGPIVGIIIIIVLLVIGALYFWGAQLNREVSPLPFIPGDSLCTPSPTFGSAVAEKKLDNGCSICSYQAPPGTDIGGETMTHVEKCPQ